MKITQYLVLSIAALCCHSCIATLFTTVPAAEPTAVVVAPSPTPTTTTVIRTTAQKPQTVVVQSTTYQSAEMLDLQAIAAAFMQSRSVEEFENLINNHTYFLCNLDLNNDGFVDYLRVLETVSGWQHVFLIQAALAPNVYRDVATLTADVPMSGTCTVYISGAQALYGANYVLTPVVVRTPAIYTSLRRTGYSAWRSPYGWNHYPTVYTQRAPQYPSHYKGYVEVYMKNHRYTHEAKRPTTTTTATATTTATRPQTTHTSTQHVSSTRPTQQQPQQQPQQQTVTTKVNTHSGRVTQTKTATRTATTTSTATTTTTRTATTHGGGHR